MKKLNLVALAILSFITFGGFLGAGQPAAPENEKLVQLSDQFVRDGLTRYSVLDRSRILRGLADSIELLGSSSQNQTRWSDFIRANLDALVKDLIPSKEEDQFVAAANLIDIDRKFPVPGFEACLEDWKQWAVSPRFIGPDSDIGRLGLALVILHARPDAKALAFAETLIEAMLDASVYENDIHRFGTGPENQALAHRLLAAVSRAPVESRHIRRLKWMLVTHYKHISRRLGNAPVSVYDLEDALLSYGFFYHGWRLGSKIMDSTPAALELPHHYSVIARFALEKQRDAGWLAQAKSQPTPRLVVTPSEWEKMLARNKTAAFAADIDQVLKRGDEAIALEVPVYYEPASNLDERGKTNALAGGVGRKMSPLRAAYLATGDEKYGRAYKDVVMAQVRQFEDYGDFRCPYNLNVPGPWDGLGAVVSYTGAYDILVPKGLISEDEKNRIIWMVREIGRELEWTLTYSNFIVHNAWARWAGSMGFLVNYWTDIPEADAWKTLAEKTLPKLYSGIDKDGGWYEKTINYHLFTLDLLERWFTAVMKLQAVDLFDREFNGRRLSMMLDWLVKMTPPGGEVPLFNDGQKLNLNTSGTAIDMAYTLGRGDFFKAIDYPLARPEADSPDRPVVELRTPDFTSVLLEESGYGIFRSGWEKDDLYFAIKFGEHGGGHGHYDKASIYVHAFGRPWLIDPGYGLKATYQHNTVVVDGADQERATGTLLKWHDGPGLDLVAVSHRAYKNIEHRRTVFYVKPASLLVVDRLEPLDGQSHVYDWMLQFNTDNGKSAKDTWTSAAGDSGIRILFPGNDREGGREFGAAVNVNELPSNYQRMGNENLYLQIWRGKWTKKFGKPVVFASLIEPFKGKAPSKTLTQKTLQDGIAVEVTEDGKKQVFEVRWDGRCAFTGPDGKKIEIR
jgi:hypothetical protein